jgi:hypothetical protein
MTGPAQRLFCKARDAISVVAVSTEIRLTQSTKATFSVSRRRFDFPEI